jgi:hypothetical protein
MHRCKVNSQDYKIGTVCVGGRCMWEGGDKGEGIWLMDFIYIYKIKQ